MNIQEYLKQKREQLNQYINSGRSEAFKILCQNALKGLDQWDAAVNDENNYDLTKFSNDSWILPFVVDEMIRLEGEGKNVPEGEESPYEAYVRTLDEGSDYDMESLEEKFLRDNNFDRNMLISNMTPEILNFDNKDGAFDSLFMACKMKISDEDLCEFGSILNRTAKDHREDIRYHSSTQLAQLAKSASIAAEDFSRAVTAMRNSNDEPFKQLLKSDEAKQLLFYTAILRDTKFSDMPLAGEDAKNKSLEDDVHLRMEALSSMNKWKLAYLHNPSKAINDYWNEVTKGGAISPKGFLEAITFSSTDIKFNEDAKKENIKVVAEYDEKTRALKNAIDDQQKIKQGLYELKVAKIINEVPSDPDTVLYTAKQLNSLAANAADNELILGLKHIKDNGRYKSMPCEPEGVKQIRERAIKQYHALAEAMEQVLEGDNSKFISFRDNGGLKDIFLYNNLKIVAKQYADMGKRWYLDNKIPDDLSNAIKKCEDGDTSALLTYFDWDKVNINDFNLKDVAVWMSGTPAYNKLSRISDPGAHFTEPPMPDKENKNLAFIYGHDAFLNWRDENSLFVKNNFKEYMPLNIKKLCDEVNSKLFYKNKIDCNLRDYSPQALQENKILETLCLMQLISQEQKSQKEEGRYGKYEAAVINNGTEYAIEQMLNDFNTTSDKLYSNLTVHDMFNCLYHKDFVSSVLGTAYVPAVASVEENDKARLEHVRNYFSDNYEQKHYAGMQNGSRVYSIYNLHHDPSWEYSLEYQAWWVNDNKEEFTRRALALPTQLQEMASATDELNAWVEDWKAGIRAGKIELNMESLRPLFENKNRIVTKTLLCEMIKNEIEKSGVGDERGYYTTMLRAKGIDATLDAFEKDMDFNPKKIFETGTAYKMFSVVGGLKLENLFPDHKIENHIKVQDDHEIIEAAQKKKLEEKKVILEKVEDYYKNKELIKQKQQEEIEKANKLYEEEFAIKNAPVLAPKKIDPKVYTEIESLKEQVFKAETELAEATKAHVSSLELQSILIPNNEGAESINRSSKAVEHISIDTKPEIQPVKKKTWIDKHLFDLAIANLDNHIMEGSKQAVDLSMFTSEDIGNYRWTPKSRETWTEVNTYRALKAILLQLNEKNGDVNYCDKFRSLKAFAPYLTEKQSDRGNHYQRDGGEYAVYYSQKAKISINDDESIELNAYSDVITPLIKTLLKNGKDTFELTPETLVEVIALDDFTALPDSENVKNLENKAPVEVKVTKNLPAGVTPELIKDALKSIDQQIENAGLGNDYSMLKTMKVDNLKRVRDSIYRMAVGSQPYILPQLDFGILALADTLKQEQNRKDDGYCSKLCKKYSTKGILNARDEFMQKYNSSLNLIKEQMSPAALLMLATKGDYRMALGLGRVDARARNLSSVYKDQRFLMNRYLNRIKDKGEPQLQKLLSQSVDTHNRIIDALGENKELRKVKLASITDEELGTYLASLEIVKERAQREVERAKLLSEIETYCGERNTYLKEKLKLMQSEDKKPEGRDLELTELIKKCDEKIHDFEDKLKTLDNEAKTNKNSIEYRYNNDKKKLLEELQVKNNLYAGNLSVESLEGAISDKSALEEVSAESIAYSSDTNERVKELFNVTKKDEQKQLKNNLPNIPGVTDNINVDDVRALANFFRHKSSEFANMASWSYAEYKSDLANDNVSQDDKEYNVHNVMHGAQNIAALEYQNLAAAMDQLAEGNAQPYLDMQKDGLFKAHLTCIFTSDRNWTSGNLKHYWNSPEEYISNVKYSEDCIKLNKAATLSVLKDWMLKGKDSMIEKGFLAKYKDAVPVIETSGLASSSSKEGPAEDTSSYQAIAESIIDKRYDKQIKINQAFNEYHGDYELHGQSSTYFNILKKIVKDEGRFQEYYDAFNSLAARRYEADIYRGKKQLSQPVKDFLLAAKQAYSHAASVILGSAGKIDYGTYHPEFGKENPQDQDLLYRYNALFTGDIAKDNMTTLDYISLYEMLRRENVLDSPVKLAKINFKKALADIHNSISMTQLRMSKPSMSDFAYDVVDGVFGKLAPDVLRITYVNKSPAKIPDVLTSGLIGKKDGRYIPDVKYVLSTDVDAPTSYTRLNDTLKQVAMENLQALTKFAEKMKAKSSGEVGKFFKEVLSDIENVEDILEAASGESPDFSKLEKLRGDADKTLESIALLNKIANEVNNAQEAKKKGIKVQTPYLNCLHDVGLKGAIAMASIDPAVQEQKLYVTPNKLAWGLMTLNQQNSAKESNKDILDLVADNRKKIENPDNVDLKALENEQKSAKKGAEDYQNIHFKVSVDVEDYLQEFDRLNKRLKNTEHFYQHNSPEYKSLRCMLDGLAQTYKDKKVVDLRQFRNAVGPIMDMCEKYQVNHRQIDSLDASRTERLKTMSRLQAMGSLIQNGIKFSSKAGQRYMYAVKATNACAMQAYKKNPKVAIKIMTDTDKFKGVLESVCNTDLIKTKLLKMSNSDIQDALREKGSTVWEKNKEQVNTIVNGPTA